MNKKMAITLAILTVITLIFGAYVVNLASKRESNTTTLPIMKSKLVKIEGMTCEACEQALAGAAKKIKGVESITASAKNGNAVVKYDLIKTDIDRVMKEIRKTGYRPISYEDYDEKRDKEESVTKELNSTMKCGAGKCGESH
ncbi:MAG: heavy metal-associated domain-containing protein [Sulfurimonas sp.]|nr:heavy metal-associated domain-containing protein [Sulfurimonas sp.]